MVENSEIPKGNGFTVTEQGVVRDGITPKWIQGIYKLTRSVLLQPNPIQKVSIKDRSGAIDEDIELLENEMHTLFKGRYIIYLNGMYDPINHKLRVEQYIQDEGW